jgi:WD40 repeat protein
MHLVAIGVTMLRFGLLPVTIFSFVFFLSLSGLGLAGLPTDLPNELPKVMHRITGDQHRILGNFNADGTQFFTKNSKLPEIQTYDIITGAQISKWKTDDLHSATTWYRQGHFFLALTRALKVWSAKEEKFVFESSVFRGNVISADISKNGKLIVASSKDSLTRVWRLEKKTFNFYCTLKGHKGLVNFVAFDSKGEQIVTAGEDNEVRLWNAFACETVRVFSGHTEPVNMARLSSDDTMIATASSDGSIGVWDATNGKRLQELREHTRGVSSAVFRFNSTSELLSTSLDGTIKIWDLTQNNVTTLDNRGISLVSAEYSPDDSKIITADRNGVITVWGLPLSFREQRRITKKVHIRSSMRSSENDEL